MPNVVALHPRQVFLSAGETAPYALLTVTESGTETQVQLFSDPACTPGTERSQPVESDVNGVFPVCYTATGATLRLLVADQGGAPLPGYPMDDVTPIPTGTSRAEDISATPFDAITAQSVQAQLEQVYAVATEQTDEITQRFSPFVTGGAGNAYTLTPSPAATTYAAGQSWIVRPDRTNTGAATLNVSGLGTRNIMKYNTDGALVVAGAGEVQAYREFLAYDDGTQIIMLLGRDFPVRTSNANGTSTRFADGTQTCRIGRLELTTAGTADHVAGVWTYPQAFANTTDLVVTPALVPEAYSGAGTTFADSATGVGDRAEITGIVPGVVGLTTATIRVFSRVDFTAGAKLWVNITAIGNWR